MAGRRAQPPSSVASSSLATTGIPEVDRVLKQVEQALQDLQRGKDAATSPFFDTVITPAQLTAAVTNWDVGQLGTITLIRASADAVRAVSGLVGGADGKVAYIINIGTAANTPSFQHEAGAATAGNRFHNAGAAAVTGGAAGCVAYYYDGADRVWRNLGST